MKQLPANEENLEMAGRIGRAWREIRRGAAASALKETIYGPCLDHEI
jgi:hypothetical protein